MTALLVTSACSFVLVRDPPARPPPPPAEVSCTTSAMVPGFDTAVAVLSAIGAVYFLTSDEDNAGIGAVVEGGLAIGFGVSAFKGWRSVGRCRGMQSAPPPGPAPGPPAPQPQIRPGIRPGIRP